MPTPPRALVVAVAVLVAGCGASVSRVKEVKPPSGYRFDTYRVKDPTQLDEVGEAFGIPPGILAVVNGIPEDTAVEAGRELIVPFHGEVFPILRAGARGFLPRFRQHRARLVWPVLGGSISSRFGTRARGSFHEGVDIKAPHGTAVFAAHDGIVAYNGDRLRGYGKLLIVRGDGIATVYGHNSKNLVHEGDEVVAGTPLAAIGATGRATGPHLHFETRVKNEEGEYVAVDPLHFFSLP